jgi:hypothetical protein
MFAYIDVQPFAISYVVTFWVPWNTNNINKTRSLLQTTGGKDETNIVLCGNRSTTRNSERNNIWYSKRLDINIRKHAQKHNKIWALLQTTGDKDEPSEFTPGFWWGLCTSSFEFSALCFSPSSCVLYCQFDWIVHSGLPLRPVYCTVSNTQDEGAIPNGWSSETDSTIHRTKGQSRMDNPVKLTVTWTDILFTDSSKYTNGMSWFYVSGLQF